MLSLSVLRRLRMPAVVDSAPAPRLAVEHIDITAAEVPARPSPRPVVVDAEQVVEPADFHPDTMVASSPGMRVDRRPPAARGTCYHHTHAQMPDRGRVGLLVDGDRATLLPCPYTNGEGH